MATRRQKYRQAALTYFLYGLVYLTARAAGGLGFYLVGALLAVVFPVLVWKEFKWFTRVLAVLVLVRVGGLAHLIWTDDGRQVPLVGEATIPQAVGAGVFLLVAVVTFGMLVRAGWARGGEKPGSG